MGDPYESGSLLRVEWPRGECCLSRDRLQAFLAQRRLAGVMYEAEERPKRLHKLPSVVEENKSRFTVIT